MTEDLPLARSGRTARDVVLEIAREAGDTLVRRFGGEKQVTHKGRGNVVTDVDVLVERQVISRLLDEFPGFGILGEESGAADSDAPFTWVIDPLDGTRNYVSGVPFFSVVIALARGDDLLLGVTYDPMRDEMFLAEKGKGATLNGRPMAVSTRSALQDCLLGFDLGYINEEGRYALELMVRLWPGMQSIRLMGSSALGLAYAAAGRIDLYFHHNLAPWDMASGLLLAKEAGGAVTDKNGGPAGLYVPSVIVSSAALHAQFLRATEGTRWRG